MNRNLQSALGKIKRSVLARVRGVVRRAVMSTVDSSKPGQTVQAKLLSGRVADAVEHMEPYGFTSSPPLGSEGLVFAVGADRAHPVGINFGSRLTRKVGLQSGEVAMYHQGGTTIVLHTDGSVEISTMPLGSSVVLNADGSIDVTPGAGQTVNLSPGAGAQAVARATDPVSVPSLTTLHTALAAWTPVAADGGAALKTLLADFIALTSPEDGTITSGGTGSTST